MYEVPVMGSKAVAGNLVKDNNKDDSDYTFVGVENSIWITVGNISVYVKKSHEGVSVELFPHGEEDGESFSSCHMMYDDAKNIIGERAE